VFAGAGGPWTRVEGFLRAVATPKGGSVMVGRPGKPPRVLLDARRLRAEAGRGAVVDGLALSPDAKLVAVSAGRPGRPWSVLVVGTDGRRVASIPLAAGHRPAWIGWSDRQGSTTLAVAAVDRRGNLAIVALVALPAIPQFADRPTVPPPIYTPDWAVLGLALGLALLLVTAGLAAVVAALVHQARPALLREEEL
jgi:hypothetical protein